MHEETPFPEGHGERGEQFKAFMYRQYDLMHNLGMTVLSHIADGLGKPSNFFEDWFAYDTCSSMRLIHYKPRSSNVVQQDKLKEDELKLTTPIHTDSGFLTLLSTFNYTGLQVNTVDNKFVSVKPKPNVIVVNLGDMFSRITGYTLKATKHRVLDIGVDRYSSPFFLEPRYAARIPNSLMTTKDAEDGSAPEELVYGDWLIDKIRQFAEYTHFTKTKRAVE